MSDPVTALRRKHEATFLVVGFASSLLYSSVFLSFAFLVPVQIAFGRFGRRAGMAAAGIAVAGITVVQGWRLVATGPFDVLTLGAGVVPPLVLLGALTFMNAGFWRGLAASYRALLITAVCALATIPVLISLEHDRSISAYLEERIGSFLAPIRSASGSGYDASVLAASIDPKELVAASIMTLRNSYAAILLFVIGGSWRWGNRLSGSGSRGREETPPIDELHLPYPLLWAFLASWSLVLAAVFSHVPDTVAAIAWNCAISLSLVYAGQGLGIVTYLFKKWNMPRFLRIVIIIMAICALVTPTTGLIVAIAIPLVGVTEIWIPYRKPKGVGA